MEERLKRLCTWILACLICEDLSVAAIKHSAHSSSLLSLLPNWYHSFIHSFIHSLVHLFSPSTRAVVSDGRLSRLLRADGRCHRHPVGEPWWEYLHHGNRQTLKMRSVSFSGSQLLTFTCSPLCPAGREKQPARPLLTWRQTTDPAARAGGAGPPVLSPATQETGAAGSLEPGSVSLKRGRLGGFKCAGSGAPHAFQQTLFELYCGRISVIL